MVLGEDHAPVLAGGGVTPHAADREPHVWLLAPMHPIPLDPLSAKTLRDGATIGSILRRSRHNSFAWTSEALADTRFFAL
jgi:hypothetical protein